MPQPEVNLLIAVLLFKGYSSIKNKHATESGRPQILDGFTQSIKRLSI